MSSNPTSSKSSVICAKSFARSCAANSGSTLLLALLRATSGFPDDWEVAVVYGAALKVCSRLLSDWVFDEDPEMVQTTTSIYNTIK